jgi:hypothetical protein
MISLLRLVALFLSCCSAALALPLIQLDITGSSWGTASSFGSGDGGTTGQTVGGGTQTYFGLNTVVGATVFGFTKTTSPSTFNDYNLTGTDLGTAGTTLNLKFTGVTAAPKYVAYSGGALTGYVYNSVAQTLTISASTVNPTGSSSNNLPASGSVFGLVIGTGGAVDYQGTVFGTNMYWNDLATMSAYAGISPLTGLNANGIAGSTATFYAYLPLSYLSSIGINSPAAAQAIVQKADGSNLTLALSTTIYAPSDPGFAGGGYSYGGVSLFDFNGGVSGSEVDNYALAQYANGSWSPANIGLNAIPEPATYAVLFGSLALLAAWRRRALNNASMR